MTSFAIDTRPSAPERAGGKKERRAAAAAKRAHHKKTSSNTQRDRDREQTLAALVFEQSALPQAKEEDLDADADGETEASDVEAESDAGSNAKRQRPAIQPAWVDDDDDQVAVDVMEGQSRLRKLRRDASEKRLHGAEYVERLRQQFVSTVPTPKWAVLNEAERATADGAEAEEMARDGDEEGDGDAFDDALLRRGPLLTRSTALPSKELSVRRVTNLNEADPSNSTVAAIEWHPNAQLALTAGFDKTLRLFRTDGVENTMVQSVHLAKLPIASAAFSADGSEVLLCGRGRSLAAFDLGAGRASFLRGVGQPSHNSRGEAGYSRVIVSPDGAHLAVIGTSGALLLLSAKTKHLIATLQPANGGSKWGCQTAVFSPDGARLYTAGDSDRVRVWDVRRRCCAHTFRERGGVRCIALAPSPNGRLIAAGADSGVVTLYGSVDAHSSASPEPIKEFLNLRTAITDMRFNATSELLAFSSKYVKSSLRVAHVRSRTVFSNWPTSKTPLNYVQCCAFSPRSGYLAMGNDKGKALMYRIAHYDSA